jgi:hypothetical protein
MVYWDDTRLTPGSNWRTQIKQAIDSAKVAVLLISADFLASEFIAENELPPLLTAAQEEGAIILSVILRPSLFKYTSLAQFQTVNAPTQPIMGMSKVRRDRIWAEVAECIRLQQWQPK